MYGEIREQGAGHLQFERQATEDNNFFVLQTGTDDPQETPRLGGSVTDSRSEQTLRRAEENRGHPRFRVCSNQREANFAKLQVG